MIVRSDTTTVIANLERSSLLTRPVERDKACLEVLANDLLSGFSRILQTTSGALPRDVIRFFNNGALVQYHYGDSGRAEQVSKVAVRLCLEYFLETRSPAWVASLIQPFVNVGRLCGIMGKTREAVERFRSAYEFAMGAADLVVEPDSPASTISRDVSRDVLPCEPGLQRVLTNAYIADSIAAFTLSEDYGALGSFLEDSRRRGIGNTQAGRFMLEGEVIYFLAVAEPRRALDKAVELWNLSKRESPPDPGVLALICDAYLAGGRIDLARAVTDKMAGYCRQLAETGKWNRILRRAFSTLSIRYFLCGDTIAASRAATESFEHAQLLGDQSGAIRSACIICQTQAQSDCAQRASAVGSESLSELAETSFYRIDQLLAYLELDAEATFYDSDPGIHKARKLRIRRLIDCVGELQAKKIKQLCPGAFELNCSVDPKEENEEWMINRCLPAEQLYEALVNHVERVPV